MVKWRKCVQFAKNIVLDVPTLEINVYFCGENLWRTTKIFHNLMVFERQFPQGHHRGRPLPLQLQRGRHSAPQYL